MWNSYKSLTGSCLGPGSDIITDVLENPQIEVVSIWLSAKPADAGDRSLIVA
jgi:hypothetical protein